MTDDEPNKSTEVQADDEVETEGNGECFVIAPIGDPRGETRRQTDGLLDEAIRPVIEEEIGLNVTAAHELPEAGSITRQVIQHLLEAELVIADLTGLNANVMYELAVRHAKGKPVVPIKDRQDEQDLPFDITTERTIFYEESFLGLNELKPELKKATHAALNDEEPDNPIYRAQQDFQMREAIAGDDKMEFIMSRLDDLESRIRSASSGTLAGSGRHAAEGLTKGISWLRLKGHPDSTEPFIQELIAAAEEKDSYPERFINKANTTAGRHQGGDVIFYYTPRHTRQVAEHLGRLAKEYEVEVKVEDGALAAFLREPTKKETPDNLQATETNSQKS